MRTSQSRQNLLGLNSRLLRMGSIDQDQDIFARTEVRGRVSTGQKHKIWIGLERKNVVRITQG